jgi:hypothetical protein
MPDRERQALLLLAHAYNELNFLFRGISAAEHITGRSKPELTAGAAFILFLIKVHYSKAYEIWLALSEYSKELGDVYKTIDDAGSRSRKLLKKYFGGKNRAFLIRNGFGFHFPLEQISELDAKHIYKDNELDFYLGTFDGNAFFAFAEEVVFEMMANNLGNENAGGILDYKSFLEESAMLHKNLVEILQHAIMALARKAMEDGALQQESYLTIEQPAAFEELRLPYFLVVNKQ